MAAIMLQGTGSDVGKSVLVAGLCRLLANRGMKVLPFKPQNMSNNAAVTPDGGEIGRAQALQAIACRAELHVDMNPVLLKPQSDRTSQIVLHGKVIGSTGTGYFREAKDNLLAAVIGSYDRLCQQADIVIIEGAGSPAEINLRDKDIANMGFAREADVPVILIGDIDRGGVIASLVGTKSVIAPEDAAMIKGFLINKFRGDVALFKDGYIAITERTGWEGLGVVPWIDAARRLPAEDAVILQSHGKISSGKTEIAVLMLSRIANFDDFDALAAEPSVHLTMVPPGNPVPATASLVIIPGTKATIADLAFLRAQGWDIDIAAHIRRGGRVLGICGGYQMLGRTIADPQGIEGPAETVTGLGLLPVDTVMASGKTVRQTSGVTLKAGVPFSGYEIHIGVTHLSDEPNVSPLLRLNGGALDGAINADGRVAGCYIHGLFNHPDQRAFWLNGVSSGFDQDYVVDQALDILANELEKVISVDRLLQIAGQAK